MRKHPARISVDDLLKDCTAKRTRRSGPGGQHRNKVESAIVLTHEPTGIKAEANERRSQHENRAVAIQRLRVQLAIHVRPPTPRSPEGGPDESAAGGGSPEWKARCKNGQISISPNHEDFPSILSEALDALEAEQGVLSQAARSLGISTSQFVKLLKLEPLVLQVVNQHRFRNGLNPIR